MFNLVLILLTLTIFVTADFGHVKQTQRLQAVCRGPGIWPHPEDCRLFSVCVQDLQGKVRGQLYLCPTNQVYSTMYRRCTPRQLAPNCMTTLTIKGAAEFSSANRLLSEGDEPPTSSQHTCSRMTAPYCADSDTLVVCGPNKARIGIVQCSGKTLATHKEQSESRCVEDVCVAKGADNEQDSTEQDHAPPPSTTTDQPENSSSRRNHKSVSVSTETGNGIRSNTNSITQTATEDSPSKMSADDNQTGGVSSALASVHRQAGTCKIPGIHCADYNNATLIQCSSTLVMISEWKCEEFFPKELFEDFDSVMIKCDSQQDSCIAFVDARDVLDTDYDYEEEVKQNLKYYTPDMDQKTSGTLSLIDSMPEDLAEFKCLRDGIQCADEKTIMSCADHESEPALVLSCADMIQILDNEDAVGYCDGDISACVLMVNQFRVPLELSVFDAADRKLDCKQGELYCADNATLVACSGDADAGNYAISCGSRDGKDSLAYCDHEINSCIIDSEAMADHNPSGSVDHQPSETPLETNSDAHSLQPSHPTYNENELLPKGLTNSYSCKVPGWQCINNETIALCSGRLEVHGYLACSKALDTSRANALCDIKNSKCILREDTTMKPPSPHCHTHGPQCLDSKHIAFCTPELQLDYVLPCTQFYPNDPHPVCNTPLSTCLPSAPVSRGFIPNPFNNDAAQKPQHPSSPIESTSSHESTSVRL